MSASLRDLPAPSAGPGWTPVSERRVKSVRLRSPDPHRPSNGSGGLNLVDDVSSDGGGEDSKRGLTKTTSAAWLPPLTPHGGPGPAGAKKAASSSHRGWGDIGDGEVAELLESARQIAQQAGDDDDGWQAIGRGAVGKAAAFSAPPATFSSSARKPADSSNSHDDATEVIVDSLAANEAVLASNDSLSGSKRSAAKTASLRAAFGVDEVLDPSSAPLPPPDPLFNFHRNILQAAFAMGAIVLLFTLVPLGSPSTSTFIDALPFAVAVWGASAAVLSVMFGEQVAMLTESSLTGSLLALPALLLASGAGLAASLAGWAPTAWLPACTLAAFVVAVPVCCVFTSQDGRGIRRLCACTFAAAASMLALVLPVALSFGLLYLVRHSANDSERLGYVVAYAVVLRLQAYLLVPWLLRQESPDVHLQAQVLIVHIYGPMFNVLLWTEAPSWLLFAGMFAVQSLAIIVQVAVHESKTRFRLRIGEELRGGELCCTVTGVMCCDWMCCNARCLKACPAVGNAGPYSHWKRARARRIRPDAGDAGTGHNRELNKALEATRSKAKLRAATKLQTIGDRYVLVAMGLRMPLSIVTAALGVLFITLARFGSNKSYFPSLAQAGLSEDDFTQAVFISLAGLAWELVEAGGVWWWYAHRSVLRVSVLQVAKDFADVSMLHVNAASASAVLAWLVLSHVGIVQWL